MVSLEHGITLNGVSSIPLLIPIIMMKRIMLNINEDANILKEIKVGNVSKQLPLRDNFVQINSMSTIHQ